LNLIFFDFRSPCWLICKNRFNKQIFLQIRKHSCRNFENNFNNFSNQGSITFGRDTAGSITYGGFDTYNCGSNISYVPLSSKTFWQFILTSFTFGSYSIKKNQQAVVTTGEAIIILPDNVLQTIVTMINASAASVDDGAKWVVPCNLAPSFPSLTFNIGGNNYVVTGPYYAEPVGFCCFNSGKRSILYTTDSATPEIFL
jgi:hypothetical protein